MTRWPPSRQIDIIFNPDTKKASLLGKVMLTKDKLTVTTDRLDLDLDANTAYFLSPCTFTEKGSTLSSLSAEAFFDDETINMYGSVEVKQKNKDATAETAVYDDNSRAITLISDVRVGIAKLKNLMKEASAQKYKSEEARIALVTYTTVTCDRLEISADSGDANAFGRVHVFQNGKEAKSDQARYSEKDGLIVMTGNVSMKKEGSWVLADKVNVSVDSEVFEAVGNVETTFTIKKNSPN